MSSSESTSPSRTSKHTRIQAACRELELAIAAFDDDTEAKENARREAEKLRTLRDHLTEIKKQLDQLAD
jgi:alpha-D-ribose 1-methylphosphonate 5-triphosphate diphosphatase PhnM